MPSVVDRIYAFNQGRNPERLALKYRHLCESPARFFRGTCHLFYEDWPADSPLNTAPPVWLCGDLHLENFGTYKGHDRQVYFDINDFDESGLGPCTWDVTRLLTSVLLAAEDLDINPKEAIALCQQFLTYYQQTLADGHLGSVSEQTASGLVAQLMAELRSRDRAKFLDRRTEIKGKQRRLKFDGEKILPVCDRTRSQLADWLQHWAKTQPDPDRDADFFDLLDVGYRIAGTGSLGLERYILLVKGKGSPDRNYLLDLKAQTPASLTPYLRHPQPTWQSESDRVVRVARWLLWAPPDLFHAVTIPLLSTQPSFVLRELQPSQDRIDLGDRTALKGSPLRDLLGQLGQITAWSQLRSGGRYGSATVDQLMAFAQRSDWPTGAIAAAQAYAEQVKRDYQAFCQVR